MTKRVRTNDKLFSVSEVAKMLSLSAIRVRQLCQDGVMGEKVGSQYIIRRSEIAAYRKNRRPAGRPAKSKK